MRYITNEIRTKASIKEYDEMFSGQLILIPHFDYVDSYRRLRNRMNSGYPVWLTFRADKVEGYTRPIEPGLNSPIMLTEVRFSEGSNKYFYVFASPHYSTPVEPNTTIKIDSSAKKVHHYVENDEIILQLPFRYISQIQVGYTKI